MPSSYWISPEIIISNFDSQGHIDGLVQDCSNSSALAMELLLSRTKPSTYLIEKNNAFRVITAWEKAVNRQSMESTHIITIINQLPPVNSPETQRISLI